MASVQRPLVGVNLGGWLVLEPWMTPSLFADTGAVDEYTFCRDADPARRRRLKQFRDSFITRTDFEWLASHGVQAVRLPVGYWLFGKQGSFVKTYQYVDMVFEWADEFGIKVLLGLHGAPGSQNGKMHSGQVGAVDWPKSVDLTYEILEKIGKRFGHKPALLGFSLLNEPEPAIPTDFLQEYYQQAVAVMQPHCSEDIWFVMSDSFHPRRWRRRLPELALDHHQYQVFMKRDKRFSARWQLLRAQFLLPIKLRRMARKHRLVIGEWSLVLKRRASQEQTRRYGQLQQQAFARSGVSAHFYWNYKTEKPGLWNFRDSMERGLVERVD